MAKITPFSTVKSLKSRPEVRVSPSSVDFRGEVDFDLAMTLLFNGQLALMRQVVDAATAESPETGRKVRDYLYDVYNQQASGILATFAPDLELRPGLTEEAILKAENELLEKRAIESAQKQMDDLVARQISLEEADHGVRKASPLGSPIPSSPTCPTALPIFDGLLKPEPFG